jgi:ABC-2 type transport system permease protein
MKLRTQLYTVLTFTKINGKRFFRDKTALFFSFAFPLIFLFVFGAINNGGSDVSFKVALINDSQTPFAQQFDSSAHKQKLLKIDDQVKTLDAAKERMKRGELDATIILPQSFGEVHSTTPSGEAKVLYTQNSQSAAVTLTSLLESEFKGINKRFVSTAMPFSVTSEKVNEQSLSSFDYTFAGLLGFAIIGMGIFGPINVFPELKKMGILRRLHTTPIRVWQYFLATMLTQAFLGLLALALMFVVSVVVFDLKVVGNYFELIAFLILGIVMILGIGLALGGWAKNERQVAPLANIVVFPMMFLSGTFFPRFLMPEWLQHVSGFLPLTPVIDGIRLLATEGKHLTDIGSQLGLIALWLVVVYAIAFRVFRWE